jgi:hypothetical protein
MEWINLGFALFFLLTYLISSLFIVMKKKLNIFENTFIFLLILVININFSWILFEELRFVTVAEETLSYIAFLLNRSLIIPMILVVYVNLFHTFKSTSRRIYLTILSLGTMLLLVGVSIFFQILTYVNWNIGYDAIYFALLHLIAFYTYRFLIKFAYREVNYL